MQRESLGRKLWRVFSPVVAYFAVTFVVEFMILMVYFSRKMPELMQMMETVSTEAELMSLTENMVMDALQYAVPIAGLCALCAIPFLERMRRKDRAVDLAAGIPQKQKVSYKKYIYIVGISIPFSVGLNNLILLSRITEYSKSYQETAQTMYEPSVWVQLLCLGILIPIAEEYVYRGLMYQRMKSYLSPRTAMILSAILFGINHGNTVQNIYGIFCGILLAWVMDKYHSLWAPILAHIVINVTALCLTELRVFQWMLAKVVRVGVVTVACAAVASTIYLVVKEMGSPEGQS